MIYSPQVKVLLYQEEDGRCPVWDFLSRQSDLVQVHTRDRVALLAARGHTLRAAARRLPGG